MNNNPNKVENSTTNKKHDQVISLLLKAMEARVDELHGDICTSKTMLPLGIDTDLTTSIKQVINDPLSPLLTMRQDLDSTVNSFITLIVKAFFNRNLDIIESAFRTETASNDLHFSIVLKNDTEENRGTIFGFLREYKTTNLWDKFPIYFQFVPKQIVHKVLVKENLIEPNDQAHRTSKT